MRQKIVWTFIKSILSYLIAETLLGQDDISTYRAKTLFYFHLFFFSFNILYFFCLFYISFLPAVYFTLLSFLFYIFFFIIFFFIFVCWQIFSNHLCQSHSENSATNPLVHTRLWDNKGSKDQTLIRRFFGHYNRNDIQYI